MSATARFLPRHRTAAAPAEAAEVARPVTHDECIGLVTRALAFGLDALLINGVAVLTAAVFLLAFTVISIPSELRAVAIAIGGGVYVLWAVGYFVTFWSTTGQTPGSRLMRIRVRGYDGRRLKPRRSLLRFVALTLAALPLFAGFLLILVDGRRRGVHDVIARTVVVDASAEEDEPARRRGPGPRA